MNDPSQMRSASEQKKLRPLKPNERKLLEFLLSAEFPGREELASQMESLRVSRECECGCGTINFVANESVSCAVCRAPIPVEARGSGVDVLLFVRRGLLSSLEVVYYSDARPLPYPRPEGLELRVPQSK